MLIKSVFDYKCIAYMSAPKSNNKMVYVPQAQALKICSGSFKKISSVKSAGESRVNALEDQNTVDGILGH